MTKRTRCEEEEPAPTGGDVKLKPRSAPQEWQSVTAPCFPLAGLYGGGATLAPSTPL